MFHAGSLSIPFKALQESFKSYYMERFGEEVSFRSEISGSIEAIRKVTDLGKRGDIIAVADYALIPQLLFPKHASFYILFATNEIVLAYSEKSKYRDSINSQNWYDVLSKEGVSFGFGDPNQDPCGYRSLMVIKLSEFYYGKPVFNSLIASNTNITSLNCEIHVPKIIKVNSRKIVIRPKEVDLAGLVKSGALDYLFIYKSVAKQHGLGYVELPSEINLGNISFDNIYERTIVFLEYIGSKIKGIPVVYGIAMLRDAPNRDLALDFISYMLSEGRRAFIDNYHDFLEKPIAFGEVPKEIERLVEVR